MASGADAVKGRAVCVAGAQPALCKVDWVVAGCAPGLQGLTILYASDLHYGRWFSDKAMARLTETVGALAPDVLVLGGDLAENEGDERRLCERHLRHWRAKRAAVCVPGNNDYEAFGGDYARMGALLQGIGIQLLVNERVALPVDGGRLVVSGLDESKYGHPDGRVLDEAALPGDAHLLVTHSPWALDRVLTGARRADLLLCGHTHGGQIALGPLTAYALGYERKLVRARKYFALSGDHVRGGMRLIVSRGIGYSLLPLRIGAQPEMHLITITDGP